MTNLITLIIIENEILNELSSGSNKKRTHSGRFPTKKKNHKLIENN